MKKIIAIILVLAIKVGFAQQDLTIHLMNTVPQSMYTNPALLPTAKVYVGMPMMSSTYFGLSHNGFSAGDMFTKKGDSTYLDLNGAIDKMDKKNYFSVGFNLEDIAFGFRLKKKNYLSFNITEKALFRLGYSKDFMSFLWNGNSQFIGKTADFDGMGADFSYYREIGLGYAREINDKITVGIRPKLVFGIMNLRTEKSKVTLGVDKDDYSLTTTTDILINTSEIANLYDTIGDLDPVGFAFNTKNVGYGVDLGVSYKLTEKIMFAASVIDLGQINWKNNVRNYYNQNSSFAFKGLDINDMFSKDSTKSGGDQKLLDSLNKSFELKEKAEAYSTSLGTKIYLSGVYEFTNRFKVGAYFRSEPFDGGLHPSVTVAVNKRFGNWLGLTGSYSIVNRSYGNVGFGISTNAGSWQTYFVCDNIVGAFLPMITRTANFHFGTNFVFGYKDKKAKKSKNPKDKPKM